MKFDVTVLGTASATPTATRNPSSQFIQVNERHFLIDCGEGTQLQIRRKRLRLQKLSHIFISHLHGDHYFGLIGLLTSLSLLGRTKDLHVFSPPGLEEVIRIQLKVSESRLLYPLHFHVTQQKTTELIHEDKVVEVFSIPLVHRIPCNGYIIREKLKEPNVIKERLDEFNVPIEWIAKLKQGADFITDKGEVISNELLTTPPAEPRSYAYCSDTAFSNKVIESIKGVNMLYHEATFTEEHKKRAKETLHSTAAQAGKVAAMAGVRKLLLGHFSARYKSTEDLLKEAVIEFPSSIIAKDGETYSVPH